MVPSASIFTVDPITCKQIEAHTCTHICLHNTGYRKYIFLSMKPFTRYHFTACRF